MLNLRYVIGAFFFLSCMGSLDIIDRSLYGEWAGKPPDKLTESLHFLFLTACLTLFWLGARARQSRFNQVPPLAAAGLLTFSALWSIDPSDTFKRGGEYFFLLFGTIGIVRTFEDKAAFNLILLTVGLSVIASIILLVVSPAAALIGDPPVLRGVFSHKNQFGATMAVGVLAGLHCMRLRCRPRLLYVFLTGLFAAMVFVSRSATSALMIVIFFVAYILAGLYVRGGLARILGAFMGIAATGVLLFVTTHLELLFDFFGKDPTLTGRTDFWPYLIDDINQKPLLGWGFGAFWAPSNPAAAEIARAVGWWVPEAHNGLLELLLQSGAVGTGYFVFLLLRNFIIALRCIFGPAKQIGVSALLCFVGIVVAGVSEAVLLDPGYIWTSMFFMMGFMCEKMLTLARKARRAANIPHRGVKSQSFGYALGPEHQPARR